MSLLITGSIATDHLMTFPGKFADSLVVDQLDKIALSFLVDDLEVRRGGCAANICFGLGSLGLRPVLVGAVGEDFVDYRAWLERHHVDCESVHVSELRHTARFFCTTDLDNNQIAGFYPGASVHAAAISVSDAAHGARIGVVGATTPDAMRRHASEISEAGCPLLYDPSQQVVTLSAEDLMAGVDAAWAVAGSDYELAIVTQKTGLGLDQLARRVPLLIVTYGEQGSELRWRGQAVRIPAVPARPLVDPTGGGDAYRAGFIKGLLMGLDLPVSGRMAALAATYAIERRGTQEHLYSAAEFVERFDRSFPEAAGTISPQDLRTAAAERPALLDAGR